MDFAALDDYTLRSILFDGDQVKKIHPPQELDDSAFDNEYSNLVNVRLKKNIIRLIDYCYESRNDYGTHNAMEAGSQDESCDLDWQTRYEITKGVCEGKNHLRSEPANIFHGDLCIGNHAQFSVGPDIGPATFDSLALVRSIYNRVGQQSLDADQSIKRKIKDTTDFVLGIDKPKTIRKKGIDMDVLWCTFATLAEECNQFSVGLDIRPTTSRSLICTEMCSKYMHTHIKPMQKSPLTKDLGTEGVNFSVTDSSLQKGDASVRIQWHSIPEVETSFCPPPWFFDPGASVCSTGGLKPLLGLHPVDPVSAANKEDDFLECLRKYICLLRILSSDGDCTKTKMKKRRHRGLRKIIRPSRGRRVVSRRCLAHKSRDRKRHNPSRETRGLASRSEPISGNNSSLLTPDSTPERAWRVASAAPQHMTGYLNHLTDYTPASGDQVIDTPTMGPIVFHGSGSVNTKNMTLRDVLYVPGLEANLVSTGQLAELGYTISIGPYGCRVYKDDDGVDLVGKAHYVDGYLLELDFLRASTN